MRTPACAVLIVASVIALGAAAGGCRESTQRRTLMQLDDEPRHAGLSVADKPQPIPNEPLPAQWGSREAPAGMVDDQAPKTRVLDAAKQRPLPLEPRDVPKE